MSKFFSEKYINLEAYTPGEQPKDRKFIKLNTNESPYAPSDRVKRYIAEHSGRLQLYSNPDCSELVEKIAACYHVRSSQVLCTNGSDEILNFAFMAFCDQKNPVAFPEISYGFYSVFAELNQIPYCKIPLKEDFRIDYRDYCGIEKNIVIANPNAPTGLILTLEEIEEIVKSNPNHVVVIDEAYVDFGGESAIPLVEKYNNLLVTRTFSKSYSLAGARLGFGIAQESLINDLNTIKYSTNPYNVNTLTQSAGVAALEDNDYYMNNCKKIIETRANTKIELEKMGFEVLDSHTNFLFARNPKIDGLVLYQKLKERGVLIRHFSTEKIKQFNRITIGTPEEMQKFLQITEEILQEG